MRMTPQDLAMQDQGELGCALYRHPNGNCCPVGFLIADEHFDPEWNAGNSIAAAGPWNALQRSHDLSEPHRTMNMLEGLQQAHDNACSLNDFMGRATEVAREYSLCMPKGEI